MVGVALAAALLQVASSGRVAWLALSPPRPITWGVTCVALLGMTLLFVQRRSRVELWAAGLSAVLLGAAGVAVALLR